MKTFLTFILITGFCFAEEPVKPLPKDVQTIVDSREADLQAARIAFDKAVFEANKKAIVKMEAVVKSSTQKGDLDGALASKKFVEDWNKEKEAVAVSGGMGGAGPGEKQQEIEIKGTSDGESIGKFRIGQKIKIQYVSGTWGFGGSMGTKEVNPDNEGVSSGARAVIISPDGTLVSIPTGTSKNIFEYTVKNNGELKIRISDESRSNNVGKVKYSIIAN
jgi:hypothetical protein